jgi:hypothetical protein
MMKKKEMSHHGGVESCKGVEMRSNFLKKFTFFVSCERRESERSISSNSSCSLSYFHHHYRLHNPHISIIKLSINYLTRNFKVCLQFHTNQPQLNAITIFVLELTPEKNSNLEKSFHLSHISIFFCVR